MSSAAKHVWLLLAVKLVIVAVLAALVWYAQKNLELLQSLAAAQQFVESLGVSAGLIYPLVYAFCNIFLLPAGILSILGGFFFGLWWGFLVVLAGNLLGAAVAFLISRHVARRWIEPRIQVNSKLHAIDTAIARDGWKVIFLSQLHPLFPTSLLNYLYGLSRMRFSVCMAWVALGQAPGLFLYAYLGTLGQYGIQLLLGERRPAGFDIMIWISGLGLAVVIAMVLSHMALKAMREITEDPPMASGVDSVKASDSFTGNLLVNEQQATRTK